MSTYDPNQPSAAHDDLDAATSLPAGLPSSNQDSAAAAAEVQAGVVNPAHVDYQSVSDNRWGSGSSQHADNPQAADGAMHEDARLAGVADSAPATDLSRFDGLHGSTPETLGDLPEAGGKLDASPSHSFDATPHPELAADAQAAKPGQTPAPAGSAVGGPLSTQPAKTTAGQSEGTAFAGRPAPEGAIRGGAPSPVVTLADVPVETKPDTETEQELHDQKVEDALELEDAAGEELVALRRAVATLRSNSAASEPGTFVASAISDIEASIGRIELSAEKSGVDVSPDAVEKRRAERTKQKQQDEQK